MLYFFVIRKINLAAIKSMYCFVYFFLIPNKITNNYIKLRLKIRRLTLVIVRINYNKN